jgi:hypothetical protein
MAWLQRAVKRRRAITGDHDWRISGIAGEIMQQSKERPPKPEQAGTGATAEVKSRARHARQRKAPVTVPISAGASEATADLQGTHLPPQPAPSQSSASHRTLAAMHPQLRSASGAHPKPAAPPMQKAVAAPPPIAPAPRSTPVPVEETPDLALGRAWRNPILAQRISSPLTSPRKRAPSLPKAAGKARAALTAVRIWAVEAPRPDVVTWAAIAQAALAVLGALVFASLALRGDALALQALVFALLAGVPAGIAYALASRRTLVLLGALALVGSQIALYAWSFALIGPRPALLLLAPALLIVAMEMGGRALGGALAVGLGGIYAWFARAPAHANVATTGLDLLAVLLGLAAGCAALLALYRRITVAEAQAKHWAAEGERLDALNLAQRAQAEEESAYLRATLTEALHGRGVVRVALEGPLAKLSDMVYTVASRLMTLRRDRDERVRLEGALAQLMRAVEDMSLGGKAQWPRQTGTPVDTLSDHLRAAPWRADYRDDPLARDLFSAAAQPPDGTGSNIRYLFPRASGSHPSGV